jgi:hypothetical protein
VDTLTVVGIIGGVVIGIGAIIFSKKSNSDEKTSLDKTSSSGNTNSGSSMNKIENEVNNLESPSINHITSSGSGSLSSAQEEDVFISKVIEGDENISKFHEKLHNLNADDKLIVKNSIPLRKEILNEEIAEEKVVAGEIKQLKDVSLIFANIEKYMKFVDAEIAKPDFLVKMRNEVYYNNFDQQILRNMQNLFLDARGHIEIYGKNLVELLESNRKMINETRKLIETDAHLKSYFNDDEQKIMYELENKIHAGAHDVFSITLPSLLHTIQHVVETSLTSLRSRCENMHKSDREDKIRTEFIDAFGKDGWYDSSCKSWHENILKNYGELIKKEKDMLSLIDKLRHSFTTALAA